MVLPQFSIVVIAVKSIFNREVEAAPSYEGGIPYYYNYNGYAKVEPTARKARRARAYGS
jgi:hypothetical protein